MAGFFGNSNPQSPQQPGMEKRILLAFALMMVVLLGAQYFFKPAPAPKPATNVTPQKAEQLAQKPVQPAPVPPRPVEAVEGSVQAGAPSTQVIDTDVYHITFSNKGGVVTSWSAGIGP